MTIRLDQEMLAESGRSCTSGTVALNRQTRRTYSASQPATHIRPAISVVGTLLCRRLSALPVYTSNKMILVIMGVSGSGKSTVGSFLSKKLGWPLHEGDDYHSKENVEKMASGVPLTDQDRTPWLLCLHDIIQREMCAGTNAILTCSALKKLYRQLLLFGSRALNPSSASHQPDSVGGVLFAFLQGSYELIHTRMVARKGHFMLASLLQSQFDMLEPPSESENALTVDIQKSVPEIAAEIERALSTQQ